MKDVCSTDLRNNVFHSSSVKQVFSPKKLNKSSAMSSFQEAMKISETQTLAAFLVGVDFTATAFAACASGLPAFFVLAMLDRLSARNKPSVRLLAAESSSVSLWRSGLLRQRRLTASALLTSRYFILFQIQIWHSNVGVACEIGSLMPKYLLKSSLHRLGFFINMWSYKSWWIF